MDLEALAAKACRSYLYDMVQLGMTTTDRMEIERTTGAFLRALREVDRAARKEPDELLMEFDAVPDRRVFPDHESWARDFANRVSAYLEKNDD